MKKIVFVFLLTFTAFACFVNTGYAQINLGFSIKIVPDEPVVERPPQPTTNHVWIDGEWAWKNGGYVWVPGYWTVPERDHVWIRGHWAHKPDGSSYWENGFWKPIPHMGIPSWLPEPTYLRPPQPSPRHVWVTGEWVWQNHTFAYQTGYWQVPPHHQYWVKGHWAQWPNGEWYWATGYWKTIPQNVFVKVVPPDPNFVRPPAPSPQHEWIEGEWVWQNNGFIWKAGYWNLRDPHRRWVRGYWHQREDGGFYWIGGHWDWV